MRPSVTLYLQLLRVYENNKHEENIFIIFFFFLKILISSNIRTMIQYSNIRPYYRIFVAILSNDFLNAQVDPGRYFSQSPQCWFSRGTAHMIVFTGDTQNPLTLKMIVQSKSPQSKSPHPENDSVVKIPSVKIPSP